MGVINDGSRPARGAWVEISDTSVVFRNDSRRAPQGARGLKFNPCNSSNKDKDSRAPQGARGLKLSRAKTMILLLSSRPARGAWGEMLDYL